MNQGCWLPEANGAWGDPGSGGGVGIPCWRQCSRWASLMMTCSSGVILTSTLGREVRVVRRGMERSEAEREEDEELDLSRLEFNCLMVGREEEEEFDEAVVLTGLGGLKLVCPPREMMRGPMEAVLESELLLLLLLERPGRVTVVRAVRGVLRRDEEEARDWLESNPCSSMFKAMIRLLWRTRTVARSSSISRTSIDWMRSPSRIL